MKFFPFVDIAFHLLLYCLFELFLLFIYFSFILIRLLFYLFKFIQVVIGFFDQLFFLEIYWMFELIFYFLSEVFISLSEWALWDFNLCRVYWFNFIHLYNISNIKSKSSDNSSKIFVILLSDKKNYIIILCRVSRQRNLLITVWRPV